MIWVAPQLGQMTPFGQFVLFAASVANMDCMIVVEENQVTVWKKPAIFEG